MVDIRASACSAGPMAGADYKQELFEPPDSSAGAGSTLVDTPRQRLVSDAIGVSLLDLEGVLVGAVDVAVLLLFVGR